MQHYGVNQQPYTNGYGNDQQKQVFFFFFLQ